MVMGIWHCKVHSDWVYVAVHMALYGVNSGTCTTCRVHAKVHMKLLLRCILHVTLISHFVNICGLIWNCCKWVVRSKLKKEVNLGNYLHRNPHIIFLCGLALCVPHQNHNPNQSCHMWQKSHIRSVLILPYVTKVLFQYNQTKLKFFSKESEGTL